MPSPPYSPGGRLMECSTSRLISLTAGMIITRVSDSQAVDANIGQEIAQQLTSQPKAWIISSFAMLGFAMIPGMPSAVFFTISMLCLGSGLLQLWRAKQKGLNDHHPGANCEPEQNGVEDLRRNLTDWLADIGLQPAGHSAVIDRYVGYYRPYATSHEDLDRDAAFQEEVRNAARSLVNGVRLLRRGALMRPDAGLRGPREK